MVFERQIATARRLIDKYGETCSWQQPGDRDDNVKPWHGSNIDAPDPVSVKIVFFPNGGDNSLSEVIAALADTNVNIASEYGLMAGDVSFNPATSDTLQDSQGNNVEIVAITPLRPNGEVVLYKIWVER